MTALLQLERFTVRHGRLTAVNDVSLEAKAGEVTAVIGPNGAGKTSLVNAVMGLVPFGGRLLFPQWPEASRSIEARVRARISLVPETRDLFGPMTVLDNLRLGAFAVRVEPALRYARAHRRHISSLPASRRAARSTRQHVERG
ncbi:ATP-binding cassette domain-containing protein [Bradyrhizobium sp. USDA 4502]